MAHILPHIRVKIDPTDTGRGRGSLKIVQERDRGNQSPNDEVPDHKHLGLKTDKPHQRPKG